MWNDVCMENFEAKVVPTVFTIERYRLNLTVSAIKLDNNYMHLINLQTVDN